MSISTTYDESSYFQYFDQALQTLSSIGYKKKILKCHVKLLQKVMVTKKTHHP